MQLKFSKKSRNSERASSLGGRGLKTLRKKMSPKMSGFQYMILLSSLIAFVIVSWKDVSPVFSLTHSMPFLEKIDRAEEEPRYQSAIGISRVATRPTNISGLPTVVSYQRAHHF